MIKSSIIKILEQLENADFTNESKAEILSRLEKIIYLVYNTKVNFFDESLELFNSIAIEMPADGTFTEEDLY